MSSRHWMTAACGVLAAGFGLGAAELAAGLLGRGITPVLAVGETVIEASPTALTDWAIEAFGTANKAVLIGGILVVLAGLAAAIGVVAGRHRAAGLAAAAGLGAIAAAAVLSRPEAAAADLLPPAVGAAAAVGALAFLIGRVGEDVEPKRDGKLTSGTQPERGGELTGAIEPAPSTPSGGLAEPGRRSFFRAAAAVAVLGGAAALAGRALAGRRHAIEVARAEVDLPRPLPDSSPVPGADLEIPGGQPWQTPNPDFYRIDTALSVPLVEPSEWRLRIHGMVERELVLDFDDLLEFGLVDSWVTLCCVSNRVGGDLIGNAHWTGVRTADVLGLAGPLPDADAVLSTSHDGWTCGTPLDVLTDGRDSLFAVAMNGEPLPVEHGFPVRMVVPGLYGYVSATKWVVDLHVGRFDSITAYWTSRGWAERGPVKVASRIDVPSPHATVEAGRVPVAGVAWAQHRGIEAVEVRVDRGPWQRADLGEVPSADTWRQWVFQWDATPGRYFIEVRAVTADGEVQTGDLAPPAPDGATGWHGIEVAVAG